MLDRAVNVQPPALARDVGGQSEIEDGPVLREMLSWRQSLFLRTRALSGQETTLPCPALLGAGQLGGWWFIAIVDHIPRRPRRDASSFVAMHRGFMFGIPHGRINDQRQENDGGEIVVEPSLVSDALEIQRNRRSRAAKQRNRDGIRQANAKRADLGREKLRLYNGVD